MSDLASTAPASAGTGDGIAPVSSGQAGDSAAPAGSVSTQSRSEQPSRSEADPAGQPAAAAAPAGKTAEQWERDYKALQSAFTKQSQAYSQLGDPRSIQEQIDILQQLREHPGFIDWVNQQIAREQAGSDDPETVKALQIVQDQARQIAAEMVAPLYATHTEQKVKTTFAEMDKEFGVGWQQLKPKMNEILQDWKRRGFVSPQVEHNFDYNFVKGLYAAAAAADPAFAAKAYQRRLEQKQANSTPSQPGTAAAATAAGPVNSMRDAYAAARRQLGLA